MTQPLFKNILIIGGSSTIAAECAKQWLAMGAEHLILWGRDALKLERTRDDLRVRAPLARIESTTVEFVDARSITAQAEQLCSDFEPDLILIAHGALIQQSECETDLSSCAQSLTINALSPALFAEAFAQCLEKQGKGTLAIISSVAGDRGRRSNYVYGAAKGLLSRYAQGLQHRFAGSDIRIVLIKPGPTATPMTASLMEKGQRMSPADAVAAIIVKGISGGKSVIYAPGRWWLIMMIIRHLPAAIFNKLNI